MLKMRNEFELLDPDNMQCCKSLGDRKYSFIQAVWIDTTDLDIKAANRKDKYDNYIVVAEVVDMNELSDEDIEAEISGYYDSVEAMQNWYGLNIKELDAVVAECKFESEPGENSYDHASELVSKEEAEKIIQEFIDSNGSKF